VPYQSTFLNCRVARRFLTAALLAKGAVDFPLLYQMENEFETLRLNPDAIFLYAFKQAYLRKPE